MSIHYKDRNSGTLREEKVAGEKFLKWSCETKTGKLFTGLLGSRKCFSVLIGFVQDLRFSRRHVINFIEEMDINLKEAQRESAEEYQSFNDFFTRKLKPSSRPVDKDPHALISPADGRLLAYGTVKAGQLLQVKGMWFPIKKLLNNAQLADRYEGGSAVIMRLNPTDYHRFHFPADGLPHQPKSIRGSYYSVNPIVLSHTEQVFCRNRREITLLESRLFGIIAIIEVGAALVGSIRQTYRPNQPVLRGAEKGYFQFGGSTILMLFEPGKVKLDDDLVHNSGEGYETLVKMGERIGKAVTSLKNDAN
jgi:phosphatidylserine decarboxylase